MDAAPPTSWNAGTWRITVTAPTRRSDNTLASALPSARIDDEIDAIVRHLRSGRRDEHFETVRRHKNGHELHVSLTVSPARDGDGAIVGASTIARDVTEQKAFSEQLRASERLLRETIDHAPIGISTFTRDGTWLRANQALCEMTGYSASGRLARGPTVLRHPDDDARQHQQIGALLASAVATQRASCPRA